MNPYLTKSEILSRYYEIRDSTFEMNEWDLVFREGGKEEIVFTYSSVSEWRALWEEDALMHWMKVLKRTWDDEDFKDYA